MPAEAGRMDIYRKSNAEFVTSTMVRDPLAGGDVQVDIYRDPVSGALVGIDTSFEEDVSGDAPGRASVFNPYNAGHILILPH